MSKKSNAEGITIFNFKLYYRTIVTNTVWYWHKKTNETEKKIQK
jgi:hypothetical protein